MSPPSSRVVRQDAALGMHPVFRPVKKGDRKKLDLQADWGDARIRWRGPDVLSISDQSVLLAVLEVAQEFLNREGTVETVDRSDAIWKLLRHHKNVYRPETVSVATSYSELARRAGWNDGGSSIARVKGALHRMTETTVWVTRGNLEGSSRLLGWDVGDENKVRLVLNWRLAEALHGGHYARISLEERGAMPNEVAMALHALLSCKVNPGCRWSCGLEKLQFHVWGDGLVGASLRGRIRKMRIALQAIGRLRGWGVTWDDLTVHIGRQRRDAGTLPHATPGDTPKAETPVVTETPRRMRRESASSRKRRAGAKAPIGTGLEVADASVLFSTSTE